MLRWSPPVEGMPSGYALLVIDGRGGIVGPMSATSTSATHETGGLFTCYTVAALPAGKSDVLCGLSGVSNLGP